MKKLIFILCMLVLLALTSCSDMYAQSITLTRGGIYYEYVYDNIPVTIVDGVYYWRPLPRRYHGFVHHFDRPRYYAPYNYRPRPHIGNRIPMRPNRRINTSFTPRSSQPQRFGGNNVTQRNYRAFKYSYSFDGMR